MIRSKMVVAAVVTLLLISVVAMAGTGTAVQTTVSGPDEVVHPETITFTTTVEIRDDERIPIDTFDVTVRSADDPEKSVAITFDRDGSIVNVDSDRGVVGEGQIRIGLLERTTEIQSIEDRASHGYGALAGEDERTGEFHEFGYGYGYGYGDTQTTLKFEIELDARAFKHGEYELFVAINTEEETGLFGSNVHTFTVQLPSERAPRGDGPPDEGPVDGGNDPPSERPVDRGNGATSDRPVGPPHSGIIGGLR